MIMKVIQLRGNVSAFYLQWARMSGVVWRIVKPTYHSSVKWLIADVTDVSTLHQLSVFHAWVIVRLTLRCTTPDIRCRDRPHECDGGILRRVQRSTDICRDERDSIRVDSTEDRCGGKHVLLCFGRPDISKRTVVGCVYVMLRAVSLCLNCISIIIIIIIIRHL